MWGKQIFVQNFADNNIADKKQFSMQKINLVPMCGDQNNPFFENIVTKEEIAQNVQFFPLPQCFPLFVIGYPFNYGDFLCFDKIRSKSSAAKLSYEGKG